MALLLWFLAWESRGLAAPRWTTTLHDGWRTLAADTAEAGPRGFEAPTFDDRGWTTVAVPHNWDAYEGFHQAKHGNRHGSAWYRRSVDVPATALGKRVFLYFEGVGSYATVWVNGRIVGKHAGGLTTFTLDITDAVTPGARALVAVQADHPAGIRDLPWVCGGCERAYGFSEGSQPFGLARPVHLIVTDPVRIAPFGVHLWADAPITTTRAHVRTEVTNHQASERRVRLRTTLLAADGRRVTQAATDVTLAAGATATVAQTLASPEIATLWYPETPYLYTVVGEIMEGTTVLDRVETPFGFRWVEWPRPDGPPDQPLRVNGRPLFLNGTCDYEHLLGGSHAFGEEQIRARVRQMQAAGYNAFRDAHHPHNLRFQEYWDRDGLLWWTQFGAHIWFDNEAFRANFKTLLREWVRERRNSPSLILWGLQNESMLPTDFARECMEIIRELDPTASQQRLVTTCNGGTGTDWDVPQNWSGTYSGDPAAYADDLRQQRLVGEYGAWRSLGFHTEGGFDPKAPLSEDRMAGLMETKIRLAETVRDRAVGHFHWPFTTHANPGRNIGDLGEQARDGVLPLDHVGPANNKGLLTLWGEPLDAFYLYRANYAPAATDPMVYLVSHTWSDRWTEPGVRNGLIVYSNCDEVELFNDAGGGSRSLGRRQRGAIGTHFRWDNVEIAYGVLRAEGRIGGRVVARDALRLPHLPAPPDASAYSFTGDEPTAARPGAVYLYRVNCGGPELIDQAGQRWLADQPWSAGNAWGALSWADDYPSLPPEFGSQRALSDAIGGTREEALFRTFRYGRERLRYRFAVPDGDYTVDLFLTEPWYGTGGGQVSGWRLFDVAINGETKLRDIDPWTLAGGRRAHAVKLSASATIRGGWLEVSFPRVAANQAILSALAISTTASPSAPTTPSSGHATVLRIDESTTADAGGRPVVRTHLTTGEPLFVEADTRIAALPLLLENAAWVRRSANDAGPLTVAITRAADLFLVTSAPGPHDGWIARSETLRLSGAHAARTFTLWQRAAAAGTQVTLPAGLAASTFAAQPQRPPPPAQAITDLRGTGHHWEAAGGFRSGFTLYRDSNETVVRLPAALSDADWLRTDHLATPTSTATFRVNDHVEVYVLFDASTAPPDWATAWIPTDLKFGTSLREPASLRLVKRRFVPGDTVALGAPPADARAMYATFVRPVRAAILHPVASARGGEGVTREIDAAAPEGAALTLPGSPSATVSWTIAVGVGDRYGLNFAHTNLGTAPVAAELAIVQADGRLLRTDPLVFPAGDGSGRWTTLRVRTGESINAGTYTLRVTFPPGSRLKLGSLEVE